MDVFIDTHLSLLAQEREEELAEGLNYLSSGLNKVKELEERGCLVSRLSVESQKVGLFGRTLVSFERRGKQKLPVNSISSGDILAVFASGKSIISDKLFSGVVTKSTDSILVVAFEDIPETLNLSSQNGILQLVKLANDVTYRRLKRALETLPSFLSERCGHLIGILFNEQLPGSPNPKWKELIDSVGSTALPDKLSQNNFYFFNPSLDSSQQRAVVFALSQPDVAIIHGPPGTGKTTTVVEFIMQCTKLNQKVLACAPSNIAVDNLVERLAVRGIKIVRLGHPARLVSSVLHYSLDSLINSYDGSDIVKDIRKEMSKAMSNISSTKLYAEKRKWRSELKTLKKELLQREEKILKEILTKADVILATNTGASCDGPLKHLPKTHFNVVVIDECAQSLEASCWIPLSHVPKCVLAGDHKQLPPTILSKVAAKNGLSVTLMERLVKLYGDQITTMLTTQYRMHHHIMEWPSQCLYGGVLIAHESVANHLLKDLPGVTDTTLTSSAILFIDTVGCGLHERETGTGESKGNDGEVDIVLIQINELLQSGVPPQEISVIAPYNLQVDLIRQRLNNENISPKMEVHTVDGFQGREKEAVIITFTRSNEKGVIGFLSEQRRTNVAITRARRLLLLIGDSSTISHDPFIKGLIDYCSNHGEIHSGHEYINNVSNTDSVFVSKNNSHEDSRPQVTATCTSNKDESRNGDARKLSYPELVAQYEETLTAFNQDSEQEVVSFSSLTSAQRKALYEASEGLGLCHESDGEGYKRIVTITKTIKDTNPPSLDQDPTAKTTPTQQSKLQQFISSKHDDDNIIIDDTHVPVLTKDLPLHDNSQTVQQSSSDKPADSTLTNEQSSVSRPLSTTVGLWKCSLCGYVLPEINKETHELRCVREKRESEIERKAKTQKKKIERSKERDIDKLAAGRKKKDKREKQNMKNENNDDIDVLIAEMKLSDSVCKYPGCKRSVSLLGIKCEFCSNKHCTSHTIAEIHGCGLEAKRKAREKMMRQAQSRERGFEGGKTMDSTKRAQLQRRLDSKIEDMSTERHAKKKQSSKK